MADEPGQKPFPIPAAKSQIRRNMTRQEYGAASNGPDIDKMYSGADAIPEGYTAGDQPAGEEKLAIAEPAPIIQLVRGTGLDADKAGAFLRVKVETLTQGEIVLHLEPTMINELISMLTAGRYHVEQFAAAIGKSTTRAIMPVQSFATGDLPQMPQGVMLILNHGTPAESIYILPNAQAAREIAKALARDADLADLRSRGVIAPGSCKGVLLGPGGVPINPIGRTQ